MRACNIARDQLLIGEEAHPFSLVEFFWDLLTLLFELLSLFHFFIEQELALLA